MTRLPAPLRQAVDLARNHHLIEEDEIAVDEDGRLFFERRLSEIAEDGADLLAILPLIPSFTTTCWKSHHPQSSNGSITWPWAIR